MNRVIMMGRLTADAETRYRRDGSPVVRFNIAVNRPVKREGDPEADFFSCVAFSKLAETIDRLHISRGTKLLIEGEMRNNNYTDQNGVKRYENVIYLGHFEFCESKGSGSSSGQSAGDAPETPEKADSDDSEPVPDDVSDEGPPFV